jgi:aspartate racemase
MKKIGLVGGLAWVSTVDYYSAICMMEKHGMATSGQQGELRPLEMTIESLSLETALSYIGKDGDESSWMEFDRYHREALRRLQQSGAKCAAIASNTPHDRFESIVRGIDIPVIDIFAAVAQRTKHAGHKEVLILGTPTTMKSRRFRQVLEMNGVRSLVVEDKSIIAETFDLIERLQEGSVQNASDQIERMVRTCWGKQGDSQPAALLCCTELPLAFPEHKRSAIFRSDGVVYINSSAVHIEAIMDCARDA